VHANIALKTPAGWLGGIDFADTDASKAIILLERFAGWDKRLLALIAEADDALIPRPIHARRRPPDVPVRWRGPEPRHARWCGTRRGHHGALRRHRVALATYELALFPRSEAAAESADNLVMSSRHDGAQRLVDQSVLGSALPRASTAA
jgi:hypothetical protein